MERTREDLARQVDEYRLRCQENLRWRQADLNQDRSYPVRRMAMVAGIEAKTWYNFINATWNPEFKTLVILCAALNVQLEDIFLPTEQFKQRYQDVPGPQYVISIDVTVSRVANRAAPATAPATKTPYGRKKKAAKTKQRRSTGTGYCPQNRDDQRGPLRATG